MIEDPEKMIRVLPEDAFREPTNPLSRLSPLERLRWLQQTAYFIWRFKGSCGSAKTA